MFYDFSFFVCSFTFKILAKVFSRGALESYLPRLQDVIKSEVAKWCSEPGPVDVYSSAKSLTFRIAVSVLMDLQLEDEKILYLAKIFEQLMNNLFSLPIDAPLSGLRKVQNPLQMLHYLCYIDTKTLGKQLTFFYVQGIKAREILHANMEKIIEEKMARQQVEDEYKDAFDYMLSSAKEHGQQLSIQELKVPSLTSKFQKKSHTVWYYDF